MNQNNSQDTVSASNKSDHIHLKSRKRIIIDNFLGGIAWGLGTVIGATVLVGLIGILIVRTRSVPLVGDVVNVFMSEIQIGIKELSNNR